MAHLRIRRNYKLRHSTISNEAPPQTAEMYGGGSGRRFMTGSGKTSPK